MITVHWFSFSLKSVPVQRMKGLSNIISTLDETTAR